MFLQLPRRANCFSKGDRGGQPCALEPSSVHWEVLSCNQRKALVVHPLRKRHLYGPADISYILLIMHFERVCVVCFLDKLFETLSVLATALCRVCFSCCPKTDDLMGC